MVGRERRSGEPDAPRLRGWVHVVALVLAVPASVALIARAPASAVSSFVVTTYLVTLVASYAVSAAYHVLEVSRRTRQLLRKVDHALIYVFIAACYQPLCLLVLRNTLGNVLLAVVWGGAAVGSAAKLSGLERARRLASALYIVLGWLAVIAGAQLVGVLTPAELALILAAGVLYTLGSIVLALRRPDLLPEVFGYHEVWHVLGVLASGCYFAALWLILAPSS